MAKEYRKRSLAFGHLRGLGDPVGIRLAMGSSHPDVSLAWPSVLGQADFIHDRLAVHLAGAHARTLALGPGGHRHCRRLIFGWSSLGCGRRGRSLQSERPFDQDAHTLLLGRALRTSAHA